MFNLLRRLSQIDFTNVQHRSDAIRLLTTYSQIQAFAAVCKRKNLFLGRCKSYFTILRSEIIYAHLRIP